MSQLPAKLNTFKGPVGPRIPVIPVGPVKPVGPVLLPPSSETPVYPVYVHKLSLNTKIELSVIDSNEIIGILFNLSALNIGSFASCAFSVA